MWEATLWIAVLAATLLVFRPDLHQRSKLLGIVTYLCLTMPFFALVSRFLVNDTSIQYVAAFGGESLPLRYRFAATWAAREGPLLMWVVWMTLLAWIWREPMSSGKVVESKKSRDFRLRVVHGFSLTLLLIAIVLNPFKQTPDFFFGSGLNELLQTDLMVIHPPLIFLAYSFCIHLAAISLASIFTTDTTGIGDRMISLVRPGLFITTLGVGLGGLWAYLILDWGGYWAWDPVETGSFLPWLALVAMAHLRTRPKKVSDDTWIGAGLVVGSLALFATLVTRAGGVWASSVHTFVTSDNGTPPTDAFSRMMLLKNDAISGVEIMTYLMFILILAGCWLMMVRRNLHKKHAELSSYLLVLPIIGVLLAIPFGADLYHWIPDELFLLLLIGFIAFDKFNTQQIDFTSEGWTYFRHRYISSLVVLPVVVYLLIPQIFFVLLFTLIFTPMYYSKRAVDEWIWASFGIMLSLAGAWSGMIDILQAAMVIVIFLAPFLMEGDEEMDKSESLFSKSRLKKISLWGSVMLVSLYLILTITILLESIDTVNFDAHELYGAPFLLGFAASMLVYTRRKADAKTTLMALISVSAFSMVMAIFYSDSLGLDSGTAISEYLNRGFIAWISLPMLLVLVGPMIVEVYDQISKDGGKSILKRIPVGAHIVHLGLVLLLIGHITTTVLVDRGDASHRITLIKDEMVVDGDYGFEFTEIIATEEGLEVGDGFVGIEIIVYEIDGDEAEKIGTVEPGMLRFDRTGTARSEVDVLTRWSGDMVFIFDGTQTQGLMQQTSAEEGLDSINIVRVTIYNLPGSHLVWIGWVLMMSGMLMVTYAGIVKKRSLSPTLIVSTEQE